MYPHRSRGLPLFCLRMVIFQTVRQSIRYKLTSDGQTTITSSPLHPYPPSTRLKVWCLGQTTYLR